VPEVGLLLTALVRLASIHSRHWLAHAMRELRCDPDDPLVQMMVALAAWHQEKLMLYEAPF
jgi:hypothetical protein